MANAAERCCLGPFRAVCTEMPICPCSDSRTGVFGITFKAEHRVCLVKGDETLEMMRRGASRTIPAGKPASTKAWQAHPDKYRLRLVARGNG